MSQNLIEKIWCVLFISVFTSAFPNINFYKKENTKIIFENTGTNVIYTNIPEVSVRFPTRYSSSLIFSDDRIYFPVEHKSKMKGKTPQRRRLHSRILPRSMPFQRKASSTVQTPQIVEFRNNLPISPSSDMAQVSEWPAVTDEAATDNTNTGTDLHPIQTEKPNDNNIVPISWLEQWIEKNKYVYTNVGENETTNEPSNIINSQDRMDDMNLDFHSLFRLTNLRTGTSNQRCPPNERRNHYGMCIRPIKIILMENDSKS